MYPPPPPLPAPGLEGALAPPPPPPKSLTKATVTPSGQLQVPELLYITVFSIFPWLPPPVADLAFVDPTISYTCLMHTMLATVIESFALAYMYTPPLYVWATGQ